MNPYTGSLMILRCAENILFFISRKETKNTKKQRKTEQLVVIALLDETKFMYNYKITLKFAIFYHAKPVNLLKFVNLFYIYSINRVLN